jgi:6-phosphogluconolactonase
MKGNNLGRNVKALAVSMAVGLGMTACSRDYVVGYLYATNAKATPGLVTAYAIDYQSGALTQLSGSPYGSGGTVPVLAIASPNSKLIYVLNQGTGTVVPFAIGSDGTLTAGKASSVLTTNVSSTPTFMAFDAAGKFLYVTFRYQSGSAGPGGLATFPVNSDGTLGTSLTNTTIGTTSASPLAYIPLGNNPVGVAIPATGGFVYAVDQENPLTTSAHGVLLSFGQNVSTGALTQIPGSYLDGVPAGTTPSAIAADPSGHFIYVTDNATNQLYGYTVNATPMAGTPLAMLNSPFVTGLYPTAVKIDPRGTFVYVTNFSSSTISAYTINIATGALSGTGGGATVATGPVSVTIDPALGVYLYTANNTDNSISAEKMDPHTGALQAIQGTQFTSQGLTTSVVAVANGAHATQIVQ